MLEKESSNCGDNSIQLLDGIKDVAEMSDDDIVDGGDLDHDHVSIPVIGYSSRSGGESGPVVHFSACIFQNLWHKCF